RNPSNPSTTKPTALATRSRCEIALPHDGLHILANDLQVSGPHVAEVGSGDEHFAGETKGEVRLVFESDSEEQRSVRNGIADEVYRPAVNFGIALAELLFALLNAPVKFFALLWSDASDGRVPDPHDLRFLRFALFSHGGSPGERSWPSAWASSVCCGAAFALVLPPCVSLRWLQPSAERCRDAAAVPVCAVVPRVLLPQSRRRRGLPASSRRPFAVSRIGPGQGAHFRRSLPRNRR